MQFFSLVSIFLFLAFLFLLKRWKNINSQTKLPPGPWKLPFIGSVHHMLGGLPHRVLRDLAKKYGPLMHLQVGEVSTLVVTSPEVAKQVMKTHDISFASRPTLFIYDILCYNSTDIAFSPYGDYWKQMRKICAVELLHATTVRSFSSIRQDEVHSLVQSIKSTYRNPVNFTQGILGYNCSMTCRAAFGNVLKDQDKFTLLVREALTYAAGFEVADVFPSLKFLRVITGMKGKIMAVHHKVGAIVEDIINEHKENLAAGKTNGALGGEDIIDVLLRLMNDGGLQFPLTHDNIKAIIFDLFGAGTDTSSTTTVWAMTEIMKNPNVLAKVQAEVREAFKNKETFDEDDMDGLKYLKAVIKETLRLHPPAPLLIPRECREETVINGYNIHVKTKVIINAWALGRDPKYWDDAETFKPERFENSSLDFSGNDFQYLPFGSGRRICPGMQFGLANVYLPLAKLLFHFDWKLPAGINPSELDLTECAGITVPRKDDLYLIATPYQHSEE